MEIFKVTLAAFDIFCKVDYTPMDLDPDLRQSPAARQTSHIDDNDAPIEPFDGENGIANSHSDRSLSQDVGLPQDRQIEPTPSEAEDEAAWIGFGSDNSDIEDEPSDSDNVGRFILLNELPNENEGEGLADANESDSENHHDSVHVPGQNNDSISVSCLGSLYFAINLALFTAASLAKKKQENDSHGRRIGETLL